MPKIIQKLETKLEKTHRPECHATRAALSLQMRSELCAAYCEADSPPNFGKDWAALEVLPALLEAVRGDLALALARLEAAAADELGAVV